MISLNGLITDIRSYVREITGEEIYQNKSQTLNVVYGKFLFVKTLYWLFDSNNDLVIHLERPTYKVIAMQLAYKDPISVQKLLTHYIPPKQYNAHLELLKELLQTGTSRQHKKLYIKKLLSDGHITLTDVINGVIDLNGLVGVGLLTLGDELKQYCYNKSKNEEI